VSDILLLDGIFNILQICGNELEILNIQRDVITREMMNEIRLLIYH